MKRILTVIFVVAAIVPGALAVPVHALRPSLIAANAAAARADVLARERAQAAAKARANTLAKAKADTAAKAKAFAIARQNVQLETKRRAEAAQKAAQAQMQIRTANVQLQAKRGSSQQSVQTQKLQTVSKLQAHPVQPLRSAAHPPSAQTARPHPSTGKSTVQTSKSPVHAH